MNKIIIFLIILIVITGVTYFYLQNDNNSEAINENQPQPTIQETQDENSRRFEAQSMEGFQIKSLLIRNSANIELYSNLEDKLTSAEAMAKNDCSDLVTAGFYTESFQHIGLLISESNTISESRSNLSSSAYFSISQDNVPEITLTPPTNARLAVQSYPLLFSNGSPVEVVDNTNDTARRIVVATTNNKEVVFLVFYKGSSVFQGPTLSQLPEMISEYQQNENVRFVNALNLDGGSHSAIVSRYINMPEISTIGSYFCMSY